MKHHSHLFTASSIIASTVAIGSLIFFATNKIIAPDWDMVAVIHFLTGRGSGNEVDWLSSEILRFYDNEHRPYFPMIVWIIDRDYFDFSGHFPQAISFLLVILIGHFSTRWRNQDAWPQSARFLIFLSACCLMLSPMHWTNLVWEKQVHVYMSILFAILAFVAFEHAIIAGRGKKRSLHIILSNLCAFVSTFSFAYGLIVWPVLLVYGVWRRLPLFYLSFILIPAVLTIGFYVSTYETLGHHSDPLESLVSIGGLLKYSLLFLGGPLVAAGGASGLGILIAFGSLFVIAWAMWRARFLDQNTASVHDASLMICFFCIGVALLTGLGRLTINTGTASRYLVVAALYLLAVSALLLPWIKKKDLYTPFVLSFVSICLGLNIVMHFDHSDLKRRQFIVREGVIAAAMDVEPVFRGLFPRTAVINKHVWPYFFQRNNEAIALRPLNWLGEKLPQAAMLASDSSQTGCIGVATAIQPRPDQPGYVTAGGWARWGHRGEQDSAWILIADNALRIVGMGTSGIERPDVRKTLQITTIEHLLTDSGRSGFSGQARARSGDRLHFYAYKDGQVCRFAKNILVPAS